MDIKREAIDMVISSIEPTATVLSSVLLTGIAGQVVPGVVSSMLAYKQARSERNFKRFMQAVKDNSEEIESRLIRLEAEQMRWFESNAFSIVCDYVFDEKQEQKIDYLVNGFANAAAGKIKSTDVLIQYYDTLKDLTLIDLQFLKSKSRWKDDDFEIDNDLVISGEVRNIYSRLESRGLLETRADKQLNDLYKAVIAIIDYLNGQKKKFNPPRIRDYFLDNFELSNYGRSFLSFFCDTGE